MPILEWYFESELGGGDGSASAGAEPPVTQRTIGTAPARKKTPIVTIPKGLRSFEAEDSGFFLQLLPGPVDADGIPASIRFWKNRIETKDDPSFSVGLIYGPSGCGKSSLVKAGLLPRLNDAVIRVYVEAS
jgi:hypothetical protein